MLAYATFRANGQSVYSKACVCYSFALIIQLSIALNDRLYTRGRITRFYTRERIIDLDDAQQKIAGVDG